MVLAFGFSFSVLLTPDSYYTLQNSTSTTLSCISLYINDGYCDDQNNNANCEYDGGDCCGDNVDASWCTLCQCLDPTYTTTPTSATTPK